MDKLVFNILMGLIVAISGIIARELLPFLRKKQEEAEARLRSTKWAWAADIIGAVVRAVEQTVSEDMHGDDKKDAAIQYIETALAKYDIDLSYEEISALIEAAVNEMNSGAAGTGFALPEAPEMETEK